MWASAATAAVQMCGMTIVNNTTLSADLFCPVGQGLLVDGNDVILDLNGHTIRGGGASGTAPPPYFYTAGVRVVGGTGAIVKNGTIQAFAAGFALAKPARAATATALTLLDNGNGVAIQLPSSQSPTDSNRIEGNLITRSVNTAILVQGDKNVVTANSVVNNSRSAIVVSGPFGGTLSANTLLSNSISQYGTASPGFASVFVSKATDTTVDGNSVGPGTGTGVVVADATKTVLNNNSLTANAVGIEVGPNAINTTVTTNSANNNTGNGIWIRSASTTVNSNTANSNGAWGVQGLLGMFGTNAAVGNVNPPQCDPITIC
ncbi:MAG: right-handed parallel beta-helix repeat-containing protein [Actinobacteria bacterium]|nr:right-handed parallel beta-helix repeat-containing protein [Actinomycetota bacterium]